MKFRLNLKVVSSVLMVILLFTGVLVTAKPITQLDSRDIVVRNIDIEDVPHHITPVEVQSEEEAINNILKVSDQIRSSKVEILENNEVGRDYRGHRYASKSLGPLRLEMYVNYLAKWNTTYGNYYASASEPSTDIVGLMVGFDWRHNPTGSYSNIGSDPRKLSARGQGYLDYYTIIAGNIKYFTVSESITATWGQP